MITESREPLKIFCFMKASNINITKLISLIYIFISISSIAQCQTVSDYCKSANDKFNTQNYAGAVADYTMAIKLYTDGDKFVLASLYVFRANNKELLTDYRGAVQDYSKAIELEPSFVYYRYRAKVKQTLKDYYGAIDDYNNAIKLEKQTEVHFQWEICEMYYERGICKLMTNQQESGCLDLSKAGEFGCSEAYDMIQKYCH